MTKYKDIWNAQQIRWLISIMGGNALIIQQWLDELWQVIRNSACGRVEYYDKKRYPIGIVGIIGFLLYYFVATELMGQQYENIGLRIVGALLFLPLMMHDKWPKKYKKFLPLAWHVAILYSLPFFFTFMMLKNNSSAFWMASSITATFVVILVVDWILLILHCAAGWILAGLIYYVTTENPQVTITLNTYLPILIFAIAVGVAANYASLMVAAEQEKAMIATASSIAHEVRTPLLSMGATASGLADYLPTLTMGYEFALRNNHPMPRIRRVHMQSIRSSLERFTEEVGYSNAIIDMLMHNVKRKNIDEVPFGQCSIQDCLKRAMDDYPFQDGKKILVDILNNDDFMFVGNKVAFVYVLSNLLALSLRSIAIKETGSISIEIICGKTVNTLIFRHTGRSMSLDSVIHVFDRFYKYANDADSILGGGIGLAYCKDVMSSMGGQIYCNSTYDKSTEFTMEFPSI